MEATTAPAAHLSDLRRRRHDEEDLGLGTGEEVPSAPHCARSCIRSCCAAVRSTGRWSRLLSDAARQLLHGQRDQAQPHCLVRPINGAVAAYRAGGPAVRGRGAELVHVPRVRRLNDYLVGVYTKLARSFG
jgi:hypothetical protein